MLMPTTTMFPSGRLIPAYRLDRSDVTLYQLLRDYRHIAPGADGENDTSVDRTPPYSDPIPKVPAAYVTATSHLLGSAGIIFRRDLGMMDAKISKFMASILPEALVKPVDLNTSLKNIYGQSYSLSLQMQAGPFKLINHILSSLRNMTQPNVGHMAGHHGCVFGNWHANRPLDSADYDITMPNGGFVAIDRKGHLDYIYAMDTHSPTHLLGDFNGSMSESAIDRLERWAQEGHKMSNVTFRDVENLGGLHDVVRRMMLICTSQSPKLYILSSYKPRTQVFVSCRYKRTNTAPIDYEPGAGITLDVRKVSMTILLLAMSTKHHSMPTEPWDHAFLWPTELQIRTWTVEAAVGKDNDATLRRSSRLSGQAVATGVDFPKEEIPGVSKLRLTTSASASTDFDVTQDGYRTQRRIKAYQINGNDSFRPVRIEKWQNPDVLKIRRRRSALPECVQFDLPDVDPDMRLDFEHFLHSGSLSDVYFGSLHIKDQPSVQVAIKVVVPDLCFRAADLPKDTGNDQQMIPDDGSSSLDDQQSQPSLSAEEVRALIIAEARNYLTCLIDSPASPAFYGLWQVLLLITEHLPQSFIPATASQQDWSDIKERYYQLDNLGVTHAALPANWRAKNDAWYMIDYAQTESNMNPPATWNQGLNEWQHTIQEWCDLATDAVYSMEPGTPPPPVDCNKNLRAAMD